MSHVRIVSTLTTSARAVSNESTAMSDGESEHQMCDGKSKSQMSGFASRLLES